MPKYIISVSRFTTQTRKITVEAPNDLEASDKALAMAGDVDFNECSSSDSDYEVTEIEEVKEPS